MLVVSSPFVADRAGQRGGVREEVDQPSRRTGAFFEVCCRTGRFESCLLSTEVVRLGSCFFSKDG